MKTALVLSLLAFSLCSGQAPSFDWIKATPAVYRHLQADKNGNIYAGGTAITEGYKMNHFFVRKCTAEGNVIWENPVLRPGADSSLSIGDSFFATDEDGNSYIGLLYFGNSAIAGTFTIQTPKSNQGSYDIMLLKVNSSGIVEWARQFGTSYHDFISDLDLTPDKGIVAYGIYTYGILAFGADTLPLSDLNGDQFTVKFAGDGSYQWGKQLNYNGDIPLAASIDDQ